MSSPTKSVEPCGRHSRWPDDSGQENGLRTVELSSGSVPSRQVSIVVGSIPVKLFSIPLRLLEELVILSRSGTHDVFAVQQKDHVGTPPREVDHGIVHWLLEFRPRLQCMSLSKFGTVDNTTYLFSVETRADAAKKDISARQSTTRADSRFMVSTLRSQTTHRGACARNCLLFVSSSPRTTPV